MNKLDATVFILPALVLVSCEKKNSCETNDFRSIPFNEPVLSWFEFEEKGDLETIKKLQEYYDKNPYEIAGKGIDYRSSRNKNGNIEFLFKSRTASDVYFIFEIDASSCVVNKYVYSPT